MEALSAGQRKIERAEVDGWGIAKDLGLLALLVFLPALFFWRFLTPEAANVVSLPAGDFTNLHYPYRLFETRELLQGRLPLWNPHVYSGVSSLADIQYGIFYPLNIIFSLLLGQDGYAPFDLTMQIAAQFSLSGVFTYLFARRILGSRAGAIISALAFTYGGYLTSFPVQQIIILETSVMLPLILFFLDKAIVERSLPSFVGAGVSAAVAILAGHPQTFVYVFVGFLTYTGFRLWSMALHEATPFEADVSGHRMRSRWPSVAFGLAIFAVTMFGLAAIQLIPSYELLQLSARTTVDYAFVETGFSLRELAGLLFPSADGGRYMYAGILPLVLGMAAFLSPADRSQKVFWLVLGFVTLVFAFGSQTFLHPIAYLMVPGFKLFRDQERTIFLFSFAVAILSGYGARAIAEEIRIPSLAAEIRQRYAARAHWLRWSAILVALFGLASFLMYAAATGEQKKPLGELTDRAFLTLITFVASWAVLHLGTRQARGLRLCIPFLVGILILDLFSSNWRNNIEFSKPENLFPSRKTTEYIRSDARSIEKNDVFRVYSEGLLPAHGNAGPIYELEDIVGDSPLELQANRDFEKNVDEIRRWQLLNVKYVLTKRKLDDARLIPVMQEDEINTYELAPGLRLPRARIVHRATVATSQDEELKLTKAIEPHLEVVLAKRPGLSLPDQPPDGATAQITSRRPDRLELKTASAANGVLVLSEIFYPGWKASVDGRPVEILRANYLLRAIPVEAGSHKIEVYYDPLSFRQGLTIASISGALALAAIVFSLTVRLRSEIKGKPSE